MALHPPAESWAYGYMPGPSGELTDVGRPVIASGTVQQGANGVKSTVGDLLTYYKAVVDAWKETPVEWYPIPIAVGAILLVAVQYRRKSRQASKEVQLDEHGHEVIKLKGPWHVRFLPSYPGPRLTPGSVSCHGGSSIAQFVTVMGIHEQS